MSGENKTFHKQRERQCRDMAKDSSDADVRHRHEELADLHADAAERGEERHS